MSGNTTTRELFETITYRLPEWGITLRLLKTPDVHEPDECWFSVRPVCVQLVGQLAIPGVIR
jgi:hypothetical protein